MKLAKVLVYANYNPTEHGNASDCWRFLALGESMWADPLISAVSGFFGPVWPYSRRQANRQPQHRNYKSEVRRICFFEKSIIITKAELNNARE